jgi:hypothetical protein
MPRGSISQGQACVGWTEPGAYTNESQDARYTVRPPRFAGLVVLLWLQMCCCGGCLSGYRSRRWRLATTRRPRARRAALPLRRQPPARATARQPQPRSARRRGRHAPHRPLPPRDMRARTGVPDAAETRSRPRRKPSEPATRRTLEDLPRFPGGNQPRSGSSPHPRGARRFHCLLQSSLTRTSSSQPSMAAVPARRSPLSPARSPRRVHRDRRPQAARSAPTRPEAKILTEASIRGDLAYRLT